MKSFVNFTLTLVQNNFFNSKTQNLTTHVVKKTLNKSNSDKTQTQTVTYLKNQIVTNPKI